MAIEIVPMELRHIPQIARLEKICFSQPWSENSLAMELSEPAAHFLVAEDAGEVLGYIGGIETDGCYITNVAVFPEFRDKGIGAALLRELEKDASERKREFITLEVRKSNSDAIRLYARLGYENVGERKNFYVEPAENAVIMTKRLG